MHIAVIGGGVMGRALMQGFTELEPRPQILLLEKDRDRASEVVAELGVVAIDSPDAIADADVVLLAVKPQDFPSTLADVGAHLRDGATVISIAAGIRTDQIAAMVAEAGGPAVDVVRVMPNTPAQIGQGVMGVSAGEGCSTAALERAKELMATSGLVVVIPEEQQNLLTAISGSGPAYVFLLAETLIAAAVARGMDADTAVALVKQLLVGSSALYAQSELGAGELRTRVTSPGGTTAAAIAVFENEGLAATVDAAVAANIARSEELAQ